jgi:catechol 2,3-dioxygenase-like lactoylglutathione lyase family enzyme
LRIVLAARRTRGLPPQEIECLLVLASAADSVVKRGVRLNQWKVPDGRAPSAARGNCVDPLHRLGRCRALSALLHRSTRRPGGTSRRPGQCCASQQLDRHQWRRGPTDDKPTVILETPRDPDRVSSFLNIRVKDIDAVYAEWSARGAQFLTPPKQHQYEKRCYIRDPDGHLIEVGQTTDPEGDWSPAHWPSSTAAGKSE